MQSKKTAYRTGAHLEAARAWRGEREMEREGEQREHPNRVGTEEPKLQMSQRAGLAPASMPT